VLLSASGVRWSLDREMLRAGESRGVSNESIDEEVVIRLHAGSLIVAEASDGDAR
jgi:thiamine pyrophosphokinase